MAKLIDIDDWSLSISHQLYMKPRTVITYDSATNTYTISVEYDEEDTEVRTYTWVSKRSKPETEEIAEQNPEKLSKTGASNPEENWKVTRTTDIKHGAIYGQYTESWRRTVIS